MNRLRTWPTGRIRRPQGDLGGAMVAVLLLLGALTAITTTVATVALNDSASASRDRQSGGAFATADAGIAYGMEYIRNNSLDALKCDVAAAPSTCAANPAISNPGAPVKVKVSGTGACVTGDTCYDVWIGFVTRYNPPSVKSGLYRIHSVGRFGGSPGAKALTVDVQVTPAAYPIGVYGTRLVGNGGTNFVDEQLFTQDCVSPRFNGSGNGTRFEGKDPYWGEFAAAHSTSQVSTTNNCGSGGFIHTANACPTNSAFRYDRTATGGPIDPNGLCSFDYVRPDGTVGKRTSTLFNLEILQRDYAFQPGGLSDSQFKGLKARAQSLTTYYTSNPPTGTVSARLTAAVAAGVSQPVLYFDNVADVKLSSSDIPAPFTRAPGATCTPFSVVVVIRNGNLTYQGGTSDWRDLALFVPEGNFTGNGGYNILGTAFTQELSVTGGQKFQLDECFIRNLPGPVLDLKVVSFREDDRRNVG